MSEVTDGQVKDVELLKLAPLLELQSARSHLPKANELLIEQFETEEGWHTVFFPFEGRLVHEGMASLVAYRLAQKSRTTFSLAYNDYGFELLSDHRIQLSESLVRMALNLENVSDDVNAGVNSTEMANRKFRDIAVIGGLVFTGYPGDPVRERHLQANSGLFF